MQLLFVMFFKNTVLVSYFGNQHDWKLHLLVCNAMYGQTFFAVLFTSVSILGVNQKNT
uniref:Uncharacterized protein n=1 Tax=Anguilla anguilla TaxID=7936 RepID=A0A0E9TSV6_ANGAN